MSEETPYAQQEPHGHECPECGDGWKHADASCLYPRYTTWHEIGARDYTLPEYPCPDHQWSDHPPSGYPGERWEGGLHVVVGGLHIGVGGQ
jgi:hypothetical protein